MNGATGARASLFAALSFAMLLSGCAASRPHWRAAAALPPLPPNWQSIPNPIPRALPPAPLGNPPFYDVDGRRYYVLGSAAGYHQIGIASWYGPNSQGHRTADGERYSMYAMTAASTVLPLPTFVRVTDLANGRSVIVKVDDRGPFVAHRVIDLSYLAAAKLGMLATGTAIVEVSAIGLGSAESLATALQARSTLLYAQVGAFTVPGAAERVFNRLRAAGLRHVIILSPAVSGGHLYRVRIGPVHNAGQFERIAARLTALGYHGTWLVTP